MHTTISALSPAELQVLARVRLDVTAHLAAEAGKVEPSLLGAARRGNAARSGRGNAARSGRGNAARSGRGFLLKLACPGCPPAYVAWRPGGEPTAYSGGERPRGRAVSLTLRFTSRAACARALSGGGGTPIPIPRGPGALAALAYFRAAAPRAAGLIGDPSVPAPARARLLAVAALRGLAAVGSTDPALAERMAHVPDGSVSVEAPGSFSLGIVKRGSLITALDAAPGHPSARLSFRDPGAALAVLSGRRAAVVALGAGEVTMNGLLPLVQGMFGVLDRLAEYLGVSAPAARGKVAG